VIDDKMKRAVAKLKQTREEKNLTLQQLADIAGVAPSTIQKIEAGTIMPSVAVMMKIAKALHKKVGFFLDEEEGESEVSFVRKGDRLSSGVNKDGFSAQRLTAVLIDPEIDSLILTLAPGTHSGDEPLRHRGEELAYCIYGTVTFTINGAEYTLSEGDSLHFKSEYPHTWRNSGNTDAEMILICTLPAFSEKGMF
jgi:transcriptional regulator with XRE-family HTH domain